MARDSWRAQYEAVAQAQPDLVRDAGPVVAGFSATTDALHRIDARSLGRLLGDERTSSSALDEGRLTLRSWVSAGRDGELFIDDEGAASGLVDLVGAPSKIQCGGTAVQACWGWSSVGLSPILALCSRNALQLSVAPERTMVFESGRLVPIVEIDAIDDSIPPSNHVLEFEKGVKAQGIEVKRSSRITVVFRRKRLQLDHDFFAHAAEHVSGGVGLVSGLNGLGRRREEVVPLIAHAARGWQEHGARLVHLELAEYSGSEELAEVLDLLGGAVTSVGMNADELARLVGSGSPPKLAGEFALAHRLERVVVHGDRWALSVHRGDPGRERLGLLAGCLAAASRAERGSPSAIWSVPEAAKFADPDLNSWNHDGLRTTIVSSPYLASPRSTIGLGDTFVSGDLLVHSG